MPSGPDTIWIDVGGTRTTASRDTAKGLVKFFSAPSDPERLPWVVRWVRPRGARIVIGLRGAWTPVEKNGWFRRLKLKKGDRVMSDVELAHELAFDGGDGILLNAGTGSIAFGRAGKKTARAGGLGPLIGDDGSAFWIGREYLRRVGLRRLGFKRVRAVVTGKNPVAAVAAFAKRSLAENSPETRAILDESRAALIELIADVRRQLGGKPLPIAVRGGLFKSARFRDAFQKGVSF